MSNFADQERDRMRRHVANVRAERCVDPASGEIPWALSVRQPWAWLLVHGPKDVENRSWPTQFRGWCLVHAAQTFDLEGWNWVRENFPTVAESMPGPCKDAFQTGGMIGAVNFTDCVKQMESRWFAGPFGFVVGERKVLPFRKCRGQLGFFTPKYEEETTNGHESTRMEGGK